jgi:predicted ribosomally synthesized peptide with nif11-like leader
MAQMKELYEKVAKDSALQAKLNEILENTQEMGQTATGEKLVAFAKSVGYDITLEEMTIFFEELAEKKEGEISDAELDMVAGGKKGDLRGDALLVSIGGWGVACGLVSILGEYASHGGHCKDQFYEK